VLVVTTTQKRLKNLKIKLHRSIQGTVKTCTIKRQAERWYACFSVEYEPVAKAVSDKAVGIDIGIQSFAVLSDGVIVENPKYLQKTEKKLIRKQR